MSGGTSGVDHARDAPRFAPGLSLDSENGPVRHDSPSGNVLVTRMPNARPVMSQTMVWQINRPGCTRVSSRKIAGWWRLRGAQVVILMAPGHEARETTFYDHGNTRMTRMTMKDGEQKVAVALDAMVVKMLEEKARIAHLSFDECLFEAIRCYQPPAATADADEEPGERVTP